MTHSDDARGGSREPAGALGRLDDVLDQISDGVLVYDQAGGVVHASARAADLLGLAPEALVSLAMPEGAPPAGHPLEALGPLWPALLAGARQRFTCRGRRDERRTLELEGVARTTTAAGEAVILVELRDVTAQRRDERALRESKRQLEAAVLVRTGELQKRMRLLEEQERTLLELSTPVIQVWEGVLVLPLIGTLDRKRSAHLLENLLSSIVETASDQVLLDVTGVPLMDSEVSGYLLKTVRAAQLLGATCALVGMSPAVARSLTELEVDWSSVKTFRNLQAGLQATISRRHGRLR